MLDNEVRVSSTTVSGLGVSSYSTNLRDTITLIDALSTEDAAFRPALEGIKKRLNTQFTAQFPADISQIESLKGNNAPILKFPRSIFGENYSTKEAIEFLLRSFLRFVNNHLNPIVKSEDLIKHLEPQIARIVTGKEREAQEDQVLEFLGTESPAKTHNIDTGKEIARPKTKPSRKDGDTVLEGSDDTVISKDHKATSTSDPNTKVLGEELEHSSLYKNLFRNMVNIYRNEPNGAWRGFAIELSKVANNKDATALVIANIINVMYKIKSDDPTFSGELLEQVLKDVKKNLAFYVIETQATNQDRVKAFLCEAIPLINEDKLLQAIRSDFDSKELAQNLRSFDTKSIKASTSDLPLAIAAMKSADPDQLRIGHSGGSSQLRLTGTSTGSKAELTELAVDPDFLELHQLYGKPSQKINADYLASNLEGVNFNTEDPFAKCIPGGILLCLEKAYERESLKKQEPGHEELKYFTHLDEMTEYLKTLANAINTCPEFIELCKKFDLNMSPAKFAITQILMEFIGSNTEKQRAYFQALERLESLDDFKGMKPMIENIQAGKREREKAKLYEEVDAEASQIAKNRMPLKAELIVQLEELTGSSPDRIKRINFSNLGKPNSKEISEQSAQGFLRRLLLPHLADPNTIFLLNQHQDEALYEIFYLATGKILLNSTKNKEIKIYDPKDSSYLKLSFDEFSKEFSKGLQVCKAAFHTDRKESFLKVLGKDFEAQSICQTIENNSSQLFEDVKNLANSGEGWDREKFGQKIQDLRNDLEKSGLISIITGSSDSPTATRETAIAARRQGKQQVSLINTLSNIWRAISGSITNPDPKQIASIEANLKQLAS